MPRIAIVGSGFKGISDALLLSQNPDNDISIFERSSSFGGVSQSRNWCGFRVDYGVHMFDSVPVQLADIVSTVMSGDVHEVDFKSCSAYNNKLTTGFSLPDIDSLDSQSTKDTILHELKLLSDIKKKNQTQDNPSSLEDLLRSRYGNTACSLFSEIFKSVYHLSAVEADASALSRTSLGRLKFMNDDDMRSLKSYSSFLDSVLAARRSAMGKIDDYVTIYPSDGNGMGGFCDKAFDYLESKNIHIHLASNVKVTATDSSHISLSHNNELSHFDHIIWAADSFSQLESLCSVQDSIDDFFYATPMNFATICLDADSLADFTYFQNFSRDAATFRSSAAGLYSNQIHSNNKTFLTVECPSSLENLESRTKDDLSNLIIDELVSYSIINSSSSVHDISISPLKKSFKVPLVGFSSALSLLEKDLSSFCNLSFHSPALFFRRELFLESQSLCAQFL